MRKAKSNAAQQVRKAPATLVILILMLIVHFLGYVMNVSGGDVNSMIARGAYYKAFILAGEYWRFLSAGFVHSSIVHLLMNAWSLIMIGTVVENMLGTGKYLIVLPGSMIGGYVFLFATEGNTLCVGLSGGLYGILAVFLLRMYLNGAWKVKQFRSMILEMILVNMMLNFMPGVAWKVHLGGFLSGLLLGFATMPDPVLLNMKRMSYACLLAFIAVLCFGCYRNNRIAEDEIYAGTDIHVLQYEKKIGLDDHAVHMAERLDEVYDYGTLIQDALKEN